MKPKSTKSLPAYAIGAAALSGGISHAAVIYQEFETVLSDPSPTALNTNTTPGTLGVLLFNGTTISYATTATNGGISFQAREDYVLNGEQKNAVVGISGTGTEATLYRRSETLLSAGDVVEGNFVAGTNLPIPAGSAINQYIGVVNAAEQYGWVRFSYVNGGETIYLHDAAFESVPGAPIIAGSVIPEPSALALAGLAGGLAALRRRRAA